MTIAIEAGLTQDPQFGVVQTFDANSATLGEIALVEQTMYFLEIWVAGKRPGSFSDFCCFRRRALVYRETGLDTTIVGPVDTTFRRRTNAAYNVTLAGVGDNLVVTVTGADGHDLDWSGYFRTTGFQFE